jgi:hypothetical protein
MPAKKRLAVGIADQFNELDGAIGIGVQLVDVKQMERHIFASIISVSCRGSVCILP